MYRPAVFCLRVQGELGANWAEYLSVRSMSVELDQDGCPVTVLTTDAVDQCALIGIINHVNMLGMPLVSVECVLAER
jgi:hypothetical protein